MECDRQLMFPVVKAPHWWRFRECPSEVAILFPGSFWRDHPYAVPSFICAALALLSLAFGVQFIEEVSMNSFRS